MDTKELREAMQSQHNRYAAMLAIFSVSLDPMNDPRIWTLIENSAEFARHLMIDVCEVKNEKEATATRH